MLPALHFGLRFNVDGNISEGFNRRVVDAIPALPDIAAFIADKDTNEFELQVYEARNRELMFNLYHRERVPLFKDNLVISENAPPVTTSHYDDFLSFLEKALTAKINGAIKNVRRGASSSET